MLRLHDGLFYFLKFFEEFVVGLVKDAVGAVAALLLWLVWLVNLHVVFIGGVADLFDGKFYSTDF